jgi:hypothetical protein
MDVCGTLMAGDGRVKPFAARNGGRRWGTCDPVVPARPFAPLGDIAARTGGQLGTALASAERERVFDVFLGLLRRPSQAPQIVVLDDLHWADHATLDLLRIVGRRLRDLPVLLIGTCGTGGTPAGSVPPCRSAEPTCPGGDWTARPAAGAPAATPR